MALRPMRQSEFWQIALTSTGGVMVGAAGGYAIGMCVVVGVLLIGAAIRGIEE